jgi:putative membrane protein
MMKTATYVSGLVGLAIAIFLVAKEGIGSVFQVLQLAGWGLLWLVPFHVIPLWCDATAWRVLLAPRDPDHRLPTPYLFWVAAVREATNRLLPVASIGGELVGIRLAMLRGIEGPVASASILVEVLLTVLVQYLLTALGMVLLISATQATELTHSIFLGLGLSLPVPILIFVALRYGSVFQRIERAIEKMLGPEIAAQFGGGSLDAEVQALVVRHGRMLCALLLQFLAYLIGSFENWLALRLLGHPVSIGSAIALEAVAQAIRHFIFFVPGGLGVQEAGLVIFGQMMGLDRDVALSLSLAKRMREILFGVPALLSWQWVEGRLLRRRLKITAKSRAPETSTVAEERVSS